MSAKLCKTGFRRSSIVLAAVLLLAGAVGASAQTGDSGSFTNESLQGSYSAQGEGDDRASVSYGIVTYNGKGKTTRQLTVNALGENGARRLIQFKARNLFDQRGWHWHGHLRKHGLHRRINRSHA